MFQDESWFSGNPKVVRGYGRLNHPEDSAVAKLPHKIKGAWVLYAAYEALTGHVHRYYAPRCNQTQVRHQLETLLAHYQAAGKRALIVIWDNASWHTAKALRRWYTRYNLKAKRTGQIRLLIVRLPSRSPWLNPMEPVFGQAKRRIVGRRLVPQPSRLKQKTERYFNQREKRLEWEAAQTVANT